MRNARRHPPRSVSARVSFAVGLAAVPAAITVPATYAQDLDRVILQSGQSGGRGGRANATRRRRRISILRGQYNLIRNQSMELSLGLGAAMNRETFTGEEATSSAEITGITNFDAFDIGDLDISTATSAFYAPADGGRFRLTEPNELPL